MISSYQFWLFVACAVCGLIGRGGHGWQNGRGDAEDYPFRNVSLPWDVRVEDIVKRLSFEEMQLQMGRGGAGSKGGPAPAISRLGIGPYEWDTECLRGDVTAPGNATAFPQALGLAAAFKPELIFQVAEATAREVRGKHNDFVKQGNFGYHTGASCFSPVINIMRDSRWGRNQETYGEDPYLSGVYATSFIQGLQGNDPRYVRASGGCKHFDVHAGPDDIPVSRFSFDAKVSEEDWRMTFLPAFRTCVKAGTYNLMCSYNRINGVPSCANKKLLTDIARGEWGFTGYVVSDQGAIENIISAHHYLNNSVDTVAACVNAGCNLELSNNLDNPVYFSLVDAVKQGKVTEDKVRESVRPLFYTRMRLGEFDPPSMNPYSSLTSAEVESPAHKQLAVDAAMQSFVLLKNTGGVLPLSSTKFGTIGMVGPFVNHVELGGYKPNAPASDKVSPLQALSSLANNVQWAAGCNDTKCLQYDSGSVVKAVTGTDINFVMLGTGSSIENENRDRPDLELPGQQKQLLLDVLEKASPNTPLILLLFNAGPLNITFADQSDRVSAIMECFFPAQATGTALRHVLLNDVKGAVPAARLPFTWPMMASQLPPMVNYSMVGRTYRYFQGEPLYPFGFGLSYSSFWYEMVEMENSVQAGQNITGMVVVSNAGKLDADEVVQVYIQWTNASLPAPKLQLAWFQRVTIPAGKQAQLNFTVQAETMGLWMNGGWVVSPGTLNVYIGGQQPLQQRNLPSNVMQVPVKIVGSKYLGRY